MLKTISRVGYFALIATLCVPTLGCHKSTETTASKEAAPAVATPADSQPASAPQVVTRETSEGGYFVTYLPKPNPIPLDELFSMDINVYRDAELKQRAAGVSIMVDAAMPAHHHGMNLTPRVEPIGEGSFHVTGMLFHMPGQWELYIDVQQDGRKERARFEVEMR